MCSTEKEDDPKIDDRVEQCSTTQTCLDEETGKLSNDKCYKPESCGEWTFTENGQPVTREGCILTKYC